MDAATTDVSFECADGVEPCLQAAFARIAVERMEGLPFLNAALAVETLGFRDWHGLRVGALITPWSVNLVLLPRGSAEYREIAVGQSQVWNFPAGSFEFYGHREPELGHYQQCSLFSPAEEFVTQQDARDAARAALEELLRDPVAAQTAAVAIDAAQRLPHAPLSRRSLLLGAAERRP
jgi:[NiFe] hydrogenase assembly HybE family chaperone